MGGKATAGTLLWPAIYCQTNQTRVQIWPTFASATPSLPSSCSLLVCHCVWHLHERWQSACEPCSENFKSCLLFSAYPYPRVEASESPTTQTASQETVSTGDSLCHPLGPHYSKSLIYSDSLDVSGNQLKWNRTWLFLTHGFFYLAGFYRVICYDLTPALLK